MAGAFDALWQNSLSFQLSPISIRELIFITNAPCDIYALESGLLKKIILQGATIDVELLRSLFKNNHVELFVPSEGRNRLIELHQETLMQVTRSLSMGTPGDKLKRMLNLITINLAHLYKDPSNDQALNLQFQCIKGLASFLTENQVNHYDIITDFQKQKHHYIFAQPLISSIFVLGLLRPAHMFSAKEIESLFATSYFKDIGMSSIPSEKYAQKKLSKAERKIFLDHPGQSVSILEGRLPFTTSSLKIIKYHHSFSILRTDEDKVSENEHNQKPEDSNVLSGIESMIIMVMDMVAAMISERPYRSAKTLFESLEHIKILYADKYPQEFKLIVNYFKIFFSSKK